MPRPREKGHRVAMRGVNRDLSLYPTPWAKQLSVLRGVADASERIPRSFARAGEIKHPNFFFFAWFYFTKAVSFLKRRLIFLNKEEVYRILFSHALQPQTEPSPRRTPRSHARPSLCVPAARPHGLQGQGAAVPAQEVFPENPCPHWL